MGDDKTGIPVWVSEEKICRFCNGRGCVACLYEGHYSVARLRLEVEQEKADAKTVSGGGTK